MNVTGSDLYSCVQESMWFFCNLNFPVCKFDKIRKVWKKMSICKSSCVSYKNIQSCKPMMLDIDLYFDLKRYCTRLKFLDSLFCFDQQHDTTTDCLVNFPSKCFSLNIFCLKGVGRECSYWQFLKYHHLYENLNINGKVLFSSFYHYENFFMFLVIFFIDILFCLIWRV